MTVYSAKTTPDEIIAPNMPGMTKETKQTEEKPAAKLEPAEVKAESAPEEEPETEKQEPPAEDPFDSIFKIFNTK